MIHMLRTAALIVPACALFSLAQPALAAEKAAVSAASTAQATGEKGAGESGKVCLRITPDTASRIARRYCKTKEEWALEGVEFSAKR